MTSRNDIISSIREYEDQLRKVESALAASQDKSEQNALQSLKHDLEELVSLTKETLRQSDEDLKSNNSGSCSYQNDSTKPCYDSEMALFMDEIKKIESVATDLDNCVNDVQQQYDDQKLETIKDELKAMVGRKCSAPHNHTWGAQAYHNAIVCGVDDSREYDMDNIKDFRLRVLFTNPTHKEMIPCSYYLDGDCKFDSDQCHYSHGELIPFGELKEYIEPDFTKLKRNCSVLAKMDDRMWHKGKVICANFVEKECRVRLEARNKEIDCHFENLLPLFNDDFSDSSSSEDDDGDGDDDDNDVTDVEMFKRASLVEKSLLTYSADQALGEWEKHTKGIGSKLMQKMGYVVGTGLGNDGEGIVVPISAQVLPPGRSLDYCMQLREAANGDKDLFSVERNIKRVKKKQDALNAKAYEREKSKTDMFTFLNDNILSSSSAACCNAKSSTNSNALQQKNDFKNHSNKNLNVESLKIADDIRRKEKEIRKIQESISRQSSGTEIYKRLKTQLCVKDAELANLRKSETSVAREQSLRKHKDKLSVF